MRFLLLVLGTSHDPNFSLRDASEDDVPVLFALVHDLAAYERAPDGVEMIAPMLRGVLFGAKALARAVLAETGGAVVGFALYFTSFLTWTGEVGLYLEDRFVKSEARGQGVGKALLRHLADEALRQGCARLEWQVFDLDQSAIDFYKSFGAKPLDKWTRYRGTGGALESLAA